MTPQEYTEAMTRYHEVKYATDGPEHEEKMELVSKIVAHENQQWALPALSMEEIKKIIKNEF